MANGGLDWGSIGGGAATGATTGAAFGPYGAAAGALIGAGSAALGSYMNSSAQQGIGGIDYQAPDYGDTIDYYKNNYYIPQFQNYTETPYTTGYEQYLQGGNKYAPQINRFLERQNDLSNQQFRGDLFRSSPTLRGNIAQQGRLTQQFLRGEIPPDVQAQLANRAAETSLAGGFSGSQVARNLTARDLGLTSLDMISRGQQGLGQQLGYAQALNPYQSNTLDYLMTPQQLLSTQIQQNQFGNNVYNQNQRSLADIRNQQTTAIANLMAQQAQADAGALNTNSVLDYQGSVANPWLSAGAAGLGSLSSVASQYGGGNNYGMSGNNYGGNVFGFNPYGNGANWRGEYQYLTNSVPRATAV